MTVSRSLLIGLIVSSALNVFLVGGVVGVLWVRQTSPVPAVKTTSARPPAAPVEEEIAPSAKPGLSQRPQPAPPATASPSSKRLARPPLWMAGEGLSQDSRRALRRTLREANQRNQSITRQARAERQAALQAMSAKPYDPDEVGKRLAAARALDVQARGNVEAALARYAATLSPEERSVLTEGLRQIYAPRQKSPRPGDE